MKTIKITGLILFLFSLGLFLSVFLMSSYRLTENIFNAEVKKEHQETLKEELASSFNKKISSSIVFVNTVNNAVERVNNKMRAEQKWDQVIYDNYASSLTRVSTKGLVKTHATLLCILIL